ncbi:hypothetical protein SPRG_15264 [Saprolegnia parasitica CBS 223.65]|uniref:FYVE-type domain-containing protein n=1 Tax=Saprolegnia parasitica (strain CBS 223.65) TaxID=695850 RepID=A0A067BXF8_SAPPC|nr:hypothetical protein SPRG_15264 [Saprolegnia parasitica CBS 223.65]KDO19232.1 hypothetical protein SPRG_15264 [Saprolegnia parasitica CBS 223.65]|eukprot:XP_012210066.1 hypothetical protein SPRG_15264 [Saprolegnia parasitica CBS 223.65]
MQHGGVTLDAELYGRLKQRALSRVQTELEAQYEPDVAYKVLLNKHNFTVATRNVHDSAFKKLRSAGTCHDMTLADIQYALYTADARAYREYLAVLYGEHYLEGAVLNTTLSRNAQDPFLWFGVKYMKIHLQGKAAFEPRDATYVEYTGTTRNLRGETVLFVVRETHAFPEIPPFHEVVRFQFELVQLYTLHSDGRVTFTFTTFSDPNGSVPGWLYNKTAFGDMNMDEKLPPLITMRRLLEAKCASAVSVPAKNCKACHASFSVFRSRSTCSICGHHMCKKCRVTVLSPMHTKGLVPSEKRHFCKACVIDTRRAYEAETRPSSRSTYDSSAKRSSSAPNVQIPDEWGVNHRYGLSTSSAPSVLEADTEHDVDIEDVRGASILSQTERPHRRTLSLYDEHEMRETFEQMKLSLDNQKQLLSDMQRQFTAQF